VNFKVLAADYDGTIATEGRVAEATINALARCRAAGLKLVLVTGRELPDLLTVFPSIDIFNLVVAENGGLLYDPQSRIETIIAAPPPAGFVSRLRALNIEPLSVGRTIVATREPNETFVLAAIRELGLELHIIFNKGAVMILPANVNKATGLITALRKMQIPSVDVIGIGDAENDLSFLQSCGLAVAVDNALPSVKAIADLVVGPCGVGIEELARLWIETDLRESQKAAMR
jgi:hydroxymethylpyrimidine pyrophosphatase-like HAD family hydrolase